MICEDMTRVVDMRSIANLTAAERNELEAHARTCARCAAQWGIEAGLASVRIPRISPSLLDRCRPRAEAVVATSTRRRVLRHTALAGVAFALAAAAAIQLLRPSVTDDSTEQTVELPLAPVEIAHLQPAEMPQTPENPGDAEPKTQLSPPPLLPLPSAASRSAEDLTPRLEWALARAIERHPEVVDGPAREGILVVAVALHADGRILSEAMRFATKTEYRSVDTELRLGLPQAGRQRQASRQKNSQLPDGRVLLNDVHVRVEVVPNEFDAARSNARVADIVRDKHKDLMVPATSPEIGRLIVFMSDSGQIDRESYAGKMSNSAFFDISPGREFRTSDPSSVAFLAQKISTTLGLDINQIGSIGMTTLQDGPATVGNADGSLNVSEELRVLHVLYAWPRRTGQNGPVWGQPSPSTAPIIDQAAALAIVERYMPDAFVRTDDRSVGQPTIVLTPEGRFIRSTRVMQLGLIEARRLELEQLGRNAIYSTGTTLKNHAGQTADVMFVWQAAQPGN